MTPPQRSSSSDSTSWFGNWRVWSPVNYARTVLGGCVYWSRSNSENYQGPQGSLPITQTTFAHPLPPHLLSPLRPFIYLTSPFRPRSRSITLDGLPVYYRNTNHMYPAAVGVEISSGRAILIYASTVRDRNTDSDSDYNSSPLSLGRTILGLTFQAVAGVAVSSQSSSSTTPPGQPAGHQEHGEAYQPHLLPFHFFGVIMAVAFAGSFSGIFLRGRGYHRAATILDHIGYVSTAVGFFLITSIFLPGIFTWVCWLAGAFTLLAFALAFIG